MGIQVIDPVLVFALLLNFFILANSQVRMVIIAVALQGAILGALYPVAHRGFLPAAETTAEPLSGFLLLRLALLTLAIIVIKGYVIPRLLLRAMREADVVWHVESIIGIVPTLLIGAVGTGLALVYSSSLPITPDHTRTLVLPAALATVLCGFLVLITRRKAVTQVLGYVVLENGIFTFGLLLIEAVPILVELGVVLDLFVCVFVMGIIIHHVNRSFPAATSEHLSTLRE
jgi:hydrogenase-4 component E